VRQLASGVEFTVSFREMEPTGTHIYKSRGFGRVSAFSAYSHNRLHRGLVNE